MTPTLKFALAALAITVCFSSGAEARGNHPCKAEHQTAKTACASDKHSKECRQAHKAVKDCRVAHGLPVKGGKDTPAATQTGGEAPAAPSGQVPATRNPKQ